MLRSVREISSYAEKLMPVLERLRFCMWAVWIWSYNYSSVVAGGLYDVNGQVVAKHLVQNYICIFLAAFWEYNSLACTVKQFQPAHASG